MADIPVQRSYQQILGSMIDAFCASKGIRSLRPGSSVLCSLEACSRSDMRSNQDIFAMLASIDLDKAKGLALDRIGEGEDTPRIFQRASTGRVLITDTRYVKVASKFSSAMPTPIVGSSKLYLQNASGFGTSGKLYIGRGTGNYEGPLDFESNVNQGTYWEITLSNPTTKYHTQAEVVLLGQGGNRQIAAGQNVTTPQAALSDTISFSLVKAVKLPDGEVSVMGDVVCTSPGTVGNVPAGAIQAFSNNPFTGASVTNQLPITTGRETEDDDTYRERIRTVRKTRAKAILLAIRNSVLGITSDDSASSITSASVIQRASGTTVYIDDGTGYEPTAHGVATEVLVDSAAGGEDVFELSHRPVAKACVISTNSAPFDITSGKTLEVKVGGVFCTHTFQDTDAINPRSATAYEVVASVNANVTLPYAARTTNGGTQVVLTARATVNEDIEVVGGTANTIFAFPAGRVYTLRLYKNDKLLTKDGAAARYTSLPFNMWSTPSASTSDGVSIQLGVDRTPLATYYVTDQDFIDSQTGFNGIGLNSPSAWATVLSNIIPGVSVTVEGNLLVITSNLGHSSDARVRIAGGDLVSCGMFAVGSVSGATSDYTLAINTSTIELATPLSAGDQLSAGTNNTKAFVQSSALRPSTYDPLKMWVSVDGNEQVVPHGVTPSTPLSISVAAGGLHSWGFEQLISCNGAFKNVQPGDWITLYASELPASCLGSFKAGKVDSLGDWTTIERTSFNTARVGHELVALQNASGISPVLIIGGAHGSNRVYGFQAFHLPTPAYISDVTASCDLYDPTTGTLTPTGRLVQPRAYFTATLLTNGKVFVCGGYDQSGNLLDTTEVYDPATGVWSAGPSMSEVRVGHTASKLANGQVLVAGGYGASGITATCDLYNPTANTISATAPMGTARVNHCAVRVDSGRVFVHGGSDGENSLTSSEMYDGTWASKAASLSSGQLKGAAYDSSSNKVLVVGDAWRVSSGYFLFEVYNVSDDTWTTSPTNIGSSIAGINPLVVVTADGKLVCPNLYDFGNAQRVAGTWTATGGWSIPTGNHDTLYTEAMYLFGSKAVVLTDHNSLTNSVVVMGGYDVTNDRPTAVIETFTTGTWSFPGAVSVSNAYLASRGFSVTRSSAVPQAVTATPGASLYSGTMLARLLAGTLTGASVSTWHTTSIRLSSNSYDGSLMVLGVNAAAATLGLPLTPSKASDVHVASVSSVSELQCTPSFSSFSLFGRTLPTSGTEAYDIGGGYDLAYNLSICKYPDLSQLTGGYPFTSKLAASRQGDSKGILVTPQAIDGSTIQVRNQLTNLLPGELAVGLHTLAIGPQDDLTVQVNGDVAKTYTTRLWRTIKPTSSSYSQSVECIDADAGTSLVNTFGPTFDYGDLAVYMKARAVLFGSDDRRMVARYYRFGAEGEGVNLTFDNPVAASKGVTYGGVALHHFGEAHVIRIPSGAARANPFSTGNRFGVNLASSGVRGVVLYTGLQVTSAVRDTSGNVTATCVMPTNLSAHTFSTGDQVYFTLNNSSFPDGYRTIVSTTDTTITYYDGGDAITSTNVSGYVSYNATEVRLDTSNIATDDFCFFSEAGKSFAVLAVSRYSVRLSLNYESWFPLDVTGTISDSQTVQFWANPKKSASQIVSTWNALTNTPFSLKLIGAGSSAIYKSSADEVLSATAHYTLTDGINWVASTSLTEASTRNVVFTFKKAIDPNLVTGSDWQNEQLRLVPVTATTLVRWLNTPAVSGLFNDASVVLANHRVQISTFTGGSDSTLQVQGGTANEVVATLYEGGLVKTSAVSGLSGGQWVKVQNTFCMPKSNVCYPTSTILGLDAAGYLTFSFNAFWVSLSARNASVTFERCGRFVAVRTSLTNLTSTFAGDLLRIASPTVANTLAPVSTVNCGLYKIVRCEDSVFWIEAPNAIEELCNAQVTVFDGDMTVLPGDKIYLNSPAIPVADRGVWTVESVGIPSTGGSAYGTPGVMKLSTATRSPVPFGRVDEVGAGVYVEQGVPSVYYRKVTGITPSLLGADFTQLAFDLPMTDIGPQAGSTLIVLDKLGFTTNLVAGHDGYGYSTGLIGEANKVIYGDPLDEVSYPGVIAAGVQMDITTGYTRRIQVALVIRCVTGSTQSDIAGRVKSAVASVINQSGLGESISIAALIKAAQAVPGVVSVGWVSPTYTATNDLITVQGHEKPMVLDLDNDVQVTFAGE